ncbi:YhdP family protein [Hydrogenophaga crassostreae]|nr:YhdP family protein [Hydrogenophaga crassostreae]
MAARLLLWAVLAVWGLFALTLGAIHLVIVPRIDEARPALERWAGQTLGVPVKVGAIQAETESNPTEGFSRYLPALVPSFALRDVRLYDPAGREALHLPQVDIAISVRSLWRLGFERLAIDSPTLDVRRTTDNRFEVAGLDFSGPADEDSQVADWFFSQTEFVIRRGTVRWTDDLKQQPPVALSDLSLVVRNSRRSHAFQIDATPPPERGERFSLRGRFRQPLLDLGMAVGASAGEPPWHNWSGELFADFARVDVGQLQPYLDLTSWGVTLRSGEGRLRAWTDVKQGQPVSATVDVSLKQFATTLGPKLPELAIDTLNGRVSAAWNADGFDVTSDNLQFRTAEGLDWPGGALRLKHQRAQGAQAASTDLSADRLELAALATIATRLPLPDASRALLLKLDPEGRMEGLKVNWQGPATSGEGTAEATPAAEGWQTYRYKATGRVSGLALAGGEPRIEPSLGHVLPGRPGIRGAQVEFDLNQDGGRASIQVKQGALDLPGVFEESLVSLNRLDTEARWRIQGERIEAWLDPLQLANDDTEGTVSAHWSTSDPATSASKSRFPGVLDLNARLTRGAANRVHRYLPIAIGPLAQRYVRESVLGGAVGTVDFRIRGDLWDMPFNHPDAKGEFRIAAQLKGVDFAYVPSYLQNGSDAAWPALKGVSGQLLLDRASLKLTQLQATLDGSPGVGLSQAEASIADLINDPLLKVSAKAQGPATGMLDFVRASPVNYFTGRALQRSTISGPAQLQFQLQLPLHRIDQTAVQGSVSFTGNDVHINPEAPRLQNTVGQLTFSEHGFNIPGAKAQIYGGALQFKGGMAPSPQGISRIQFTGQGTATADGLRDGGLGLVSRLSAQASGSADYQAELGFRAGLPEITVTSDLKGMAVALPAPLNKAAGAVLPLHYQNKVLTAATDVTGEVARTDRFFLQLGQPALPVATLDYERDVLGVEPRVLRGSIAAGLATGETVAMPAQGVQANIRFSEIDTDAWDRVFSELTGVDPREVVTSPAGADDISLGYLPTSLAVRAQQLLFGGRTFNNVVVGGSREGNQWRANIDAEQLNGYLEYRQPSGNAPGNIYARLAKLNLAASAKSDVEEMLQQPKSMPSLDIEVNDFTLAGRNLGYVAIQAQNQNKAGQPREWQLTKLNLRVPEARFNAIGHWAISPGSGAGSARRTALQIELDVRDAGGLLTRFGHVGTVRGGEGTIRGTIGWEGSPMSLDYGSLSGQLNANVRNGQFLKVEPGATKLLSVLSLQSLPRRLVLDFRDVFSEGFAFDFVRGDATIEQGVAKTNNLQMKGVNAAVLMEGSADIGREQQDLKVVVVPEINAGTAALIATAINPAVGLGTFIAQFLLGQPLQSAATQEFRVTGGWADPQVKKVER